MTDVTKVKSNLKTCTRGHTFKHSSDCPVCPICWPGYYKKHSTGDFDMLAAPAQRALHGAGIKSLTQLVEKSEIEISKLHGMGPNAISKLKAALKTNGLGFAD